MDGLFNISGGLAITPVESRHIINTSNKMGFEPGLSAHLLGLLALVGEVMTLVLAATSKLAPKLCQLELNPLQ